jgi:hypothetical protein
MSRPQPFLRAPESAPTSRLDAPLDGNAHISFRRAREYGSIGDPASGLHTFRVISVRPAT